MSARRVRVCHVITLLEPGGAQDNTLYTVSHLDARFLPSLVCGPGGVLDGEARRLGVPLRFLPSLARPIRPHLDALALLRLARLFREERPDIVHTHSSKAGILGRLAAGLAGVPRVVHTIHGFGFHDSQPWPVRRAFIALERLAARVTTRFIAVSRSNLEAGVALGLFTRDRVSLIRSGVRLADFERAAGIGGTRGAGPSFRDEIGVPRDAPLVGMVACLKPQKSPLTFVEVAARVVRDLPGAVFVLAGDGELRADVERRATVLGLRESFRLLGWRRDVPRLMAALDVMLHTSLWEGLPRVLPEAIACGVPIVATGVDGTADILRDGVTGIVRAPRDADGLAAGVRRLLLDRELGRELARRARGVLEEFDIDVMVRQQERLYLSLLEEGERNDTPAGPGRGRTAGTNNDGAAEGRTAGGSLAARLTHALTHEPSTA
ncbi:MAG TPA: glycosyltransferase family 4 protein [Candidatus Dormibacteraeota bacterium]|nr:glycosyltransferase family 4 protein [Candidatus Dormibacteraeota bacterium]